MLGLVLLYVDALLYINGLTLLGKIAPKGAAIMRLFAGGALLFVSLHQIATGQALMLRVAAVGLLFSFTYLWVAYTDLAGQDSRGLGGFSLFVAAPAALFTINAFGNTRGLSPSWIAACSAAWTRLWLCYLVFGALQRSTWTRPVAWLTFAPGVFTAWLPGHLMRSGRRPQ